MVPTAAISSAFRFVWMVRDATAATAATATPTSVGSQSLLARSAGRIPTLASQKR